jgi:hypothetical protein
MKNANLTLCKFTQELKEDETLSIIYREVLGRDAAPTGLQA